MCLNKRIIVNPKYVQLSCTGRYSLVHFPDLDFFYNRHPFETFDYKSFSIRRNHVTSVNIDCFYAIDTSTGDTLPVYIEVDCGKCKACITKKRVSIKHRMILEQSVQDEPPVFLTLTYRDDSLPSGGVSVRDVQLFLKRFRSYVEYHYPDFAKFRYVCFSEYGKLHGRPHYHLLLFGLGLSSPRDVLKLERDICETWHNGFVYAKLCDHGCFNYVSKYVSKGSNVPPGLNPNFCLSSRRKGGIGMPAFDDESIYYKAITSPHPLIKLKCLGKVFDVYIPKSIRDALFKSYNRVVSPKVVSQYKRFCYLSCLLRAFASEFPDFLDHLNSLAHIDRSKFRSLVDRDGALIPKEIYDRFSFIPCCDRYISVPYYMRSEVFIRDILSRNAISELLSQYESLYDILLNTVIDFDNIYNMRYLREKIVGRWSYSLVKFAELNPDTDPLSVSDFNAVIVSSAASKDRQ